jgi:hypothetical protein
MVSNVAGFGENLLNLAELQARLSAAEFRKNIESARLSVVCGVGAALLAVASLPVALAGIAELLVSALGWNRGYALLGVAGGAIVVAAVCIAAAALWLRSKPLGFPVSTEELARNLNWLRTVLRFSGRAPSRR